MKVLSLLLAGILIVLGIIAFDKPPIFRVQESNDAPLQVTTLSAAAALPAATPAGAERSRALPAGQTGQARGYLTTPQELVLIRQKAEQGLQPYAGAMKVVLSYAEREWDYELDVRAKCSNADRPSWGDEERGTPRLYARALAAHLTADPAKAEGYAQEVKTILERIMTEVETITLNDQQCQLNFGWSTPELVATADLIEAYWVDQTCTGPNSTLYGKNEIGSGPCKSLFQNWLVKNPYYVVSYTAVSSKSNWGAAGTNTTAYIADYLWDRPDVLLVHRNPRQVNNGRDNVLTPAQAYAYANKLMLERMNGYGVDYQSTIACDLFREPQQNDKWEMIKSQITPDGIIPEDARREQYCNIERYNGKYQNYPQVHLGNNIQQCELMLRRGDSSCFDNVDHSDLPQYTFASGDGTLQTTHLHPGRGSIERAIKAVIVDSDTPWRHESALEVAYRYYYGRHTLDDFEKWAKYIGETVDCAQDICFAALTHGFAPDETPAPPPVVMPPQDDVAS